MKKILTLGLASAITLSFVTGCNVEKSKNNNPSKQTNSQNKDTSSNNSSNTSKNTSQSDKEKIKPYGKLVDVFGKKMNVYEVGSGDKTIVWIPGYSEISPVLSYTKMLEKLSSKYRVVVVEPFGYGLSDVTDRDRTIENITEEIHTALQQVGVKKYALMGHSISGMYAMEYIDKYKDEVEAFIGIDSSVPSQLDEMKLITPPVTLEDLQDIPEVGDEINKQFKLIGAKVAGNKNVVQESELMNDNFEKSKKYKFPKDLPVCFFLASESIENWNLFPGENTDWVKMHSDLLKDSSYSKIHEIEGDHLLYLTKYNEMTEKIDSFLDNAPSKK